MGRHVVLSNGQLFVGLNKHGLVHDFYYPYVGLDNLTTTRSERHKIGIWVDGSFSWVNDSGWEMNVDFEENALISNITMRNKELEIDLHFQDFVDPHINAFCRHIKVINRSDQRRQVRVFMHQVFQISRAGRADTALYEPDGNYLLDYKGRCSLLVYAETSDDQSFDQYAVGNYGIEDKKGTYVDAEDGELSGNAVEHGGVDSVIRLSMELGSAQAKVVDYWVVAADSQSEAEDKHDEIKLYGLVNRLRDARRWWQEWMAPAESKLRKIDEQYQRLTRKSLLVIKAHADLRGGILASGDSTIFNYGRDYYCYCWPRDGAYAIWPLLRLGLYDEAKAFFEFCRDTIHENGYLMHKYQPDRAIGSTWHPLVHHGNRRELAIQEDETAAVMIMLGEYFKQTGDKRFIGTLWGTFIKPAANFMAEFIDAATDLPHASYDLWEEKFLTTSYTSATVYGALLVAARLAEKLEYPDSEVAWKQAAKRIGGSLGTFWDEEQQAFVKGFLMETDESLTTDSTLDLSSFYGMMMFGPQTMRPLLDKTVKTIEKRLVDKSPSGGTPRYEGDKYMLKAEKSIGNPWFIASFWLAQYYHDNKEEDKARAIMEWAAGKTLPSGILSEQVDSETGEQASVSPLVWSHAEYINTALDLADL